MCKKSRAAAVVKWILGRNVNFKKNVENCLMFSFFMTSPMDQLATGACWKCPRTDFHAFQESRIRFSRFSAYQRFTSIIQNLWQNENVVTRNVLILEW